MTELQSVSGVIWLTIEPKCWVLGKFFVIHIQAIMCSYNEQDSKSAPSICYFSQQRKGFIRIMGNVEPISEKIPLATVI